MSKPFVSVLTPTYNRRRFIPAIIECYKAQTYPKDRMEWIILDDGSDKVKDMFELYAKGIPNVRYISMDEKMNIGAKRNRLNREAKGTIMVCMDDDDFYPPERVAHAVTKLLAQPKVDLAGCSELYMYFSSVKKILKLGPYHAQHATNGTMAYTSRYSKLHFYDETVTHAEEKSFLEEYKHPMIQLDPMKVMLVISHTENTFGKERFLTDTANPFVKHTCMKIQSFIKDGRLREFYSSA